MKEDDLDIETMLDYWHVKQVVNGAHYQLQQDFFLDISMHSEKDG